MSEPSRLFGGLRNDRLSWDNYIVYALAGAMGLAVSITTLCAWLTYSGQAVR